MCTWGSNSGLQDGGPKDSVTRFDDILKGFGLLLRLNCVICKILTYFGKFSVL